LDLFVGVVGVAFRWEDNTLAHSSTAAHTYDGWVNGPYCITFLWIQIICGELDQYMYLSHCFPRPRHSKSISTTSCEPLHRGPPPIFHNSFNEKIFSTVNRKNRQYPKKFASLPLGIEPRPPASCKFINVERTLTSRDHDH
jgi:hypothetical protein